MARLLCFIIGFIALESLSHYIGVDKVANEIQVLSAIPWIYTIYRIERLHHRHNEMKARLDDHASKE